MAPPRCARPGQVGTSTPGTTSETRSVAEASGKSQPALLDRHGVARLLNVSRSFVQKLHDTGRLPSPVRLGRAVRWRRDELIAWIDAGCLSRDRWEGTGGDQR